MLKPMLLPARLLKRKANSHKGDYGHVFILAGSSHFSGAALLCSKAALRAGSGLVTLGIPESINLAVIKNKPEELITLPLPETKEGFLSLNAFGKIKKFIEKADVLVIGPGLGSNPETFRLIRMVIKAANVTSVLDADALNALNNHLGLLKKHKGQLILTPHEKEFSRLFGMDLGYIKKNRKLVAKKCAKYYNSIIVLKGHNSIVTGGTGKAYINKTGNPGMATAGSGDVLSGIIGAFLAQGLDSFNAAKFATYIHGLAGDIAAKKKTQISLIASDIIDHIPDAVKRSI